MPTFDYKARDKEGALISGQLDAATKGQVAMDLDRLGYSVMSITPQSVFSGSLSDILERMRPLQKQEVIFFTRQLATLSRAGMPLLPGLEAISAQTTNKKFKFIVEDIRKSVRDGISLSKAMGKYPKIFSELYVSMVEVGEAGGLLDKVLERLATVSTQEMEVSSRIRGAMIYPVVLMGMAVLVVNFILLGVIPRFVTVFEQSEVAMPLPTQIVLAMSWGLRRAWLPLLVSVIAGFFLFRRYAKTEKGKLRLHRMIFSIPVMGPLSKKIVVARFARTLSMLTASGIPLLQAMTVTEKTVENMAMRRAVEKIRSDLTAGSNLVQPFQESGFFSPMAIQMISIGEKSGMLDKSLEEISSFYDPEIEFTIKNLTSLLEPFMLMFMGLTVAFVALAVLLPIFNIMKAFRP